MNVRFVLDTMLTVSFSHHSRVSKGLCSALEKRNLRLREVELLD